jgi:hypothetical protein
MQEPPRFEDGVFKVVIQRKASGIVDTILFLYILLLVVFVRRFVREGFDVPELR